MQDRASLAVSIDRHFKTGWLSNNTFLRPKKWLSSNMSCVWPNAAILSRSIAYHPCARDRKVRSVKALHWARHDPKIFGKNFALLRHHNLTVVKELSDPAIKPDNI